MGVSLLQLAPMNVLAQDFPNLVDTRHDLAIYLPSASHDRDDNPQCVFCHAPRSHSLSLGSWIDDQPENILVYPYERPPEESPPGKPDGSSLVCLGCHDGTIALGDIVSRTESAEAARGETRTNFSDGHPVSLPYEPVADESGMVLESRDRLPQQVRLDARGKIQCTTCHDPHDDTYGNFLVMEYSDRTLCVACHVMANWETSAHNIASVEWNRQGPDPWPFTASRGTVAEHGCANCHTPHTAGDGRNLLNFTNEEDNCLSCHNGNVARTDIRAELNKVSHHPVELTTGVHETDEDVFISPSDRHVECVDCHDPHSARKAQDGKGFAFVTEKSGIGVDGAEATNVVTEFEMCFRCHGDGPGRRAMPTPRQHDQSNVRLQFDTGNPSFHPVVGPGNNSDVPSLIAPLAENSTIDCSDCHSSDADSRLGGQGPDGPHGSIFPSLLVRNYQTQDRTPESPTAYALCYTCHDRNSILGDESFSEHSSHVSDNNTPCSACHDPHGISFTQGNSDSNSHLINFDTSIVFPNSVDELRFEDRGSRAGACYLACHNSNHDGFSYE
jgi:predicted CXXCH cytochrome family protein